MRLLFIAAVSLLFAASAHAGDDSASCALTKVSFPAQQATAHPSVEAAAKAVGHSSSKLTSDQSAWAFRIGDQAHAIVKNPKGGVWHVPLGLAETGCGEPTLEVSGTSTVMVRIMTDDGDAGEECKPESYFWEYVLIDPPTGRIIGSYLDFMPPWAGPDGPEVTLKGGRFTANSDETLRTTVAHLKSCATPSGLNKRKASMYWVNKGRKATKAKNYDDAIAFFHNAQGIDGKNPKALSGYGYALILRNQSTDAMSAIRALKRALELGEGTKYEAAVWFNIGLANRALAEKSIPKYALEYWKNARDAFDKSNELRKTKAAKKKSDEAKAAIDRGGRPEFCEGINKFNKPKIIASIEKFFGKPQNKACEGGACVDGAYVVEADSEGFNVAVRLTNGTFAVFDYLFEAWSGAFCPWFPDVKAQILSQRYVLVSQRGFAMERWEGECHDQGYVYEAAIIDRRTGDILAGAYCYDAKDDKTGRLTLDGDTVRYQDCTGKTRSFTLKQAALCR